MNTTAPESQPEPRRRWWPVLFCVSPIVAGIALVLLIKPPSAPAAGNAAPAPADLGGKARPLPAAANEAPPANTAAADEAAEAAPGTETTEAARPEQTSTAREIDIYLAQLAHATKVGDGKGKEEAHKLLGACKPDELVDERVQAALEVEPLPVVRIEFFRAFQFTAPRDAWALAALRRRMDVLTAAAEVVDAGERQELEVYLEHACDVLVRSSAKPVPELLSLLTTTIQSEKPEWVLLRLLGDMAAYAPQCLLAEGWLAKALEGDLRALVQRGTAGEAVREQAFLCWWVCQPWSLATVQSLGQSPWDAYLPVLVQTFEKVIRDNGSSLRLGPSGSEWSGLLFLDGAQEELSKVCASALQGSLPLETKKKLIWAMARHPFDYSHDVLVVQLERKDELYGEYLAALGFMLRDDETVQRLGAASADDDPLVAGGAIEGLRLCKSAAADAELTRILEQGSNPGLKGQALGALLDRAENPRDKAALLDKYLAPEQEASLRAVAVAYVPEKDLSRLQTLAEDDESLRVRQAALTRLGARKDKALRGFFLKVATRDSSPVLRQQAKAYAEELE